MPQALGPRTRQWWALVLASAAMAAAACSSPAAPATSGTDAASGTGGSGSAAGAAPSKPVSQMAPEELAKLFPANPPEPKYEESQIKKGGTMKVAVTYDSSTLDPTTTASGGTITIANMVYNRLLKFKTGPTFKPDLVEMVPDLAKSWEVSKDGLTYTFKLNEGVKFQNLPPLNGRELTSEDVKFNWERYKSEGVHQSYYQPIATIETPDKYTIKAVMKEANPGFLSWVAGQYATIHPKELVDNKEIKDKAIGAGPWILDKMIKSERITFKKNPDYFVKGRPYLDGYEALVLPDAASRLAAFRTKQIEYGYSMVASIREVEDLLKSNPDVRVAMWQPPYATFSMSMRTDKKPFDDVRVRRAIGMAIDQQRIIDVAFNGLGFIGLNMPWPFALDAKPALKDLGPWFQYNPDQAKKLLAEAGYPKGFSTTMIMYQYSAANKDISEMAADMLKQVGINLKVQDLDYTSYNSQWVGRKYEEMANGWGTVGFDADGFAYNQLHSKSPGNRSFVNDPMIDELAVKQRVETDPAKRKAMLKQIWDRELDQMFKVNVPTGNTFDVQQPYVRNLRFSSWVSSYYAWGMMDDLWLDK